MEKDKMHGKETKMTTIQNSFILNKMYLSIQSLIKASLI